MKNKLFLLLKALNRPELERFGLYINTPLFNERKTICRLFEMFREFHPEFSDSRLTKENLFRMLYGERDYSDELMRNLFSRLYKLLENFLSFVNFEKDKFDQQYRLLDEMNMRKQEKLFKVKFARVKKAIDETGLEDVDLFLMQHRLSILSLQHFFTFPYQAEVDMDILKAREIMLRKYFVADLLSVYSMMTHDMTLHPQKKYDLDLFNDLENIMSKKPELRTSELFFELNINIIQLLLTHDDKYYYITKRILNENSTRLTRQEKSKHYTALLSYLQAGIFKGGTGKLREKFELYKEAFENEGVYLDDSIKHAEVILAVSNSLMLNEIAQAEVFVNKYADDAEEYYRLSTKYYCTGLIEYYKKNYASALRNLSKVNYDDISFKSLVRTLTLMIYFSMNDPEGFYSLVDSYRHYLKTTKRASPYNYDLSTNFINFTVKLFKGRENPEKFDVAGFKRELIETHHISRKQWLILMVQELESK